MQLSTNNKKFFIGKGNPYYGRVAFIYIPFFDSMKNILFALLFAVSLLECVHAQEKQGVRVDNVVNTLKERITLEGYAQLGYSYNDAVGGKTNTFEIKRAILMARGKITDRWSCYFMYSFANTARILEAYTEYQFLPGLTARIGEFKTAFSIENPLSPSVVELISTYSQAVNYLVGNDSSDPLFGSNGGRDLGLMIYGNVFNNFLSYKLALMNGQGINKKDGNNQKDIVGTLIANPTKWLSVGGTFIKGTGCAVGTSAINPDIAIGDNYERNRWSAGAMLKFKQLDVRSEYLHGKDGRVRSDGYYAVASIHVLPRIDVIAAVDYFNRNKALRDRQTNYVGGLQWWFYPKCRLQVQYTYRDPHLREASNLLQAQVQVRF